MGDPTTLYRVSNRYGYSPGDLVLVVEAGKLDPVTGKPACSLAEITAAPDLAGQTDQLNHDLGTYLNAANQNTDVRFNKPGGLGVTYTTDAHVYDLGTQPPQKRYKVENNQLVVDSFFGPTGSTVVADNIVQLRVQYGKDTDNDSIVDTYDNAAPANWQQVLAIRLAVVARSALAEKPTVVGGACDATNALPTWAGGTLDVSADPDWNCYRYRVFETTIPLRNLIWQQL